MRFSKWSLTLIGALVLGCTALYAQPANIPDPEQFFGHKPGADFNLIRWEKMHEYFELLGKNSDRVLVENLGETTLGNPFILAIISSPENLANVEKHKEIAKGSITEEESDSINRGRPAWTKDVTAGFSTPNAGGIGNPTTARAKSSSSDSGPRTAPSLTGHSSCSSTRSITVPLQLRDTSRLAFMLASCARQTADQARGWAA